MQKENIRLRMLVVLLSIATLSMLAIWNRANQDNIKFQSKVEKIREEKLKTQFERDSLELELFNAQNILGRYDMSLDSLKSINPKAEKQFQNILNSGQYE